MKYSKLHIEALIEACKTKNQNAQMELYERFHKSLYRTAFSILKNREDAQDAMHEGMVSAFDKLDQYKGRGSFEGWLRKIVVRKCITTYHYNLQHIKGIALEDQIELSEDPEAETSSLPAVKPHQLEDALNKINKRYSLILKLYYLEGFSHEEISNYLNWSASNCRTTLSRARAQLKKQLNEGSRI